jgi:hypothetical protein
MLGHVVANDRVQKGNVSGCEGEEQLTYGPLVKGEGLFQCKNMADNFGYETMSKATE